MRALITTWIVTLVTIATLAAWLQLTYEPPARRSGPAAAATTEQVPDQASEIQLESGRQPGTIPLGVEPTGDPTARRGPERGSKISPVSTAGVEPAANLAPTLRSAIPIDYLSETGPYGPLPIALDDLRPWQVYGQDYAAAEGRPQIAILLTHYGLGSRATADSITELPGEVSLAISPYGRNLAASAGAARAMGHEILVMVPMEPRNYPIYDPGPHTLLVDASSNENLDRLYFSLSRVQGYVGIVVEMGSRFTTEEVAVRPIMADLQRRGILFLDTSPRRTSTIPALAIEYQIPQANSDIFIDNNPAPVEIDRYLRDLEQLARRRGSAIGVGRVSYPVTVARVTAWAERLSERGIDLAPISAVIKRQAAN